MSYLARCQSSIAAVIAALKKRNSRFEVSFGGEIPAPARISVPTHADSKFQAEQALGDWAENSLKEGIDRALPDMAAVHYGFSGKAIAGDDGFKEHYVAGIVDTCKFGKRADLLIVPRDEGIPDDISSLSTSDASAFVAKSIGAIEVRSSRLEARRYRLGRSLFSRFNDKRVPSGELMLS